MKKFQYGIVAIVILIIVVTRGVMFYHHSTQKAEAKAHVIKPAVMKMLNHAQKGMFNPIQHSEQYLGHFKHIEKITSFRQFDVKGVGVIHAIVKIQFKHGVAYYDMGFHKEHDKWALKSISVFHPKD